MLIFAVVVGLCGFFLGGSALYLSVGATDHANLVESCQIRFARTVGEDMARHKDFIDMLQSRTAQHGKDNTELHQRIHNLEAAAVRHEGYIKAEAAETMAVSNRLSQHVSEQTAFNAAARGQLGVINGRFNGLELGMLNILKNPTKASRDFLAGQKEFNARVKKLVRDRQARARQEAREEAAS